MDIVVTGRHVTVSDRFRDHIDEKLAKVPQVAPRVQRVDVLLTHEPNRRQAKAAQCVEITCRGKGTVVRAEASHDDQYAALDIAMDKLLERLRRMNDKKRVHRGRRVPESVAHATARIDANGPAALPAEAEPGPTGDPRLGALAESPIEVREKVHTSSPMTLGEALQEMELVGHDFFLYHDVDTDRPSVLYRRRGWSYGVLTLETTARVAHDQSAVG